MITPGRLPLAGIRTVPFAYEIDVVGIDLTGATIAAQVRVSPDASGDPVATFASPSPIPAASVTTTAGLPTSQVTLSLTAAQMAAMPAGPEQGDPWVGAWDLVVTPAQGPAYVLLTGTFTVNPGVTHG